MRFEGPLYEGDGLIRPGPVVSDANSGSVEAPVEEPKIVQRSIGLERSVDLVEIESRARKMRAEFIGGWLARLGARLTSWLEAASRRRAEEYLARSQSHAELESRMRELERRGYVPHL
jgi:hypothetical protein